MKLSVTAFLAAGILALFSTGCAAPVNTTAARALNRSVITDGAAFTAGANPFIYTSSLYNSNPAVPRNSSDPSAVWAPTPQGNKVLMVTSSDMNQTVPTASSNYYPMSKTYLYALDPNNTGTSNWRDFGAIVSESDIPWTNHTAGSQPLNLWAPDIDFKVTNNVTTYYLFVPDVDQASGNQKIAVFARANDPFGSFASGYKDYVHITLAGGGEAPYSYDPGVFHIYAGTDISDFYLSYCDGTYAQNGRASIAHFVDDGKGGLTKAANLGRVTFRGLPGNTDGAVPNFYMEGPDLIQVNGTGDRQDPMIILQFAAKVDGSQQEYIGYGYKSRSSFAADPVNNWNFGGWIQKQIDPAGQGSAQWTNHATIVPITTTSGAMKLYYMYQYSIGGYSVDHNSPLGQMRQVSMRELHLNTDLTVQGTSSDGVNSLGHEGYPADGIAYTAQIQNLEPTATNRSHFSLYINNPTDTSAANWSGLYYFRTENGKSPNLGINFSGLVSNLKRFGTDVWAIQFDSTAMAGRYQNPNWGQFPTSGRGYEYTLSYSDGSFFDDTNDFSKTRSPTYVDTDHIPLFTANGRLAGVNPPMKITSAWTSYLGNTLTASSEQQNGNGDHVVAGMVADPTWDTQKWEIEPVPGTNGGFYRFRSTGQGTYLNVATANESETITLHGLVPDWYSEQWYFTQVPGNSSQVWISNRWTGKYLTRGNPDNNTPHDRTDYISVWSQSLNNTWDSQKWLITYQ